MTLPHGRHVLMHVWRDTRHPLGGGSETYVEAIAEQIAARGHRVTIFCASYPGAVREETRGGVTFVRRGGAYSLYLLAAWNYLAGAVGIGPMSRRRLGRPDVVVDVGAGLPFLSPLYVRVPVIFLAYHLQREQWHLVLGPLLGRVGWWVESWLAPRVVYRRSRYVTISKATRTDLASVGVDPAKVEIIYCGTPPVSGPSIPRDPYPHAVVLSRLVPHKRVEAALASIAALADEMPALRLTVAGQGWSEPKLRELTAELGIEDRVDFVGYVSEETKHELFSRAWLALTPSLKEGWGLSIVEAGSRGTPTVARACAGGVTEAVVDGETGLLADDEEHFVALVGQLLRDDQRREAMGVLAAKHAQSFTWEKSGERFAALVESLVASA